MTLTWETEAVAEHQEAEAAQREALALLTRHRAEIILRCREAMRALYQRRVLVAVGSDMTAMVNGDDATRWLDAEGCEVDRRVIGAVFRPNSGWAYVGSVKSELKRRHHRRISCWRWVGNGEARGGHGG